MVNVGDGCVSRESVIQSVTRVINDTAQLAAHRLYRHAHNEEKVDAITLDLCKFTINHAIGMPTQKSVTAGEVIIKVVYKSPDIPSVISTSMPEGLKGEVRPIPQLSAPMPPVEHRQTQDEVRAVGQSLGDAVHTSE